MLAPLRAGQLVDRVPVLAVNALVAAALALWALLPSVGTDVRRRASGVGNPDPNAQRPSPIASLPWIREPVTLCLGLFLAWNLLSLAVSIYHHQTLSALLDLAALFGAYLLLAHGGGGRRLPVWALGAFLLAGFSASLQAMAEYSLEAWGNNNPGWRAFGPFFNPNVLGATAILLVPLAFGMMLRARRTLEVAAAGAATLLFVAVLLISGSRGAALGLIAGGFAFLLTAAVRGLWPDRRRALATAALIVALLPLLWFLRVPMLGRMAGVPGTPPIPPGSPAEGASARSNAFRVLTWQATLKIVQDKPILGTGAGTFGFALPRYAIAGYTGMAHQSYLQIAAEAGLPALLAWLGALALTLGRLLSRRRGPDDWLLPGLAGGIVAAMAHNVVDYSWYVPGTALPFWLFLGAAVALTRAEPATHHGDTEFRSNTESEGQGEVQTRKAQRQTPNAQRPVSNAKRLALGAAGVLLLGLNGVWLRAALHQQSAQLAIANRDARMAMEEYQAAVALTPLDAGLQIELGGIRAAMGDREAAAAAFRHAAALAPSWGRPHYRLGRLWESAGQLEEAAAAFEQAAARDPRATQPLAALAEVLKAQGKHAAALEVYHRIVTIEESPAGQIRPLDQMTDTNPAIARQALAREAEDQGDQETAIRHYRAAAERLRRWRRDLDFQAQVRQARGETLTSRELELPRTEARLWRRLANLYSQTGQNEAAAEAQREAAAAEAKAEQINAAKL